MFLSAPPPPTRMWAPHGQELILFPTFLRGCRQGLASAGTQQTPVEGPCLEALGHPTGHCQVCLKLRAAAGTAHPPRTFFRAPSPASLHPWSASLLSVCDLTRPCSFPFPDFASAEPSGLEQPHARRAPIHPSQSSSDAPAQWSLFQWPSCASHQPPTVSTEAFQYPSWGDSRDLWTPGPPKSLNQSVGG